MDWYKSLMRRFGKEMEGIKTVAVVLFRHKGEGYDVCIGKQVKGKPSNGQWVLPGGHVHDEEDPTDAAKRELKEEAGVETPLVFCERNGDDAIFFGVVAEGTGAKASSDLLSLTWVPSEKIPKMAWDQKDVVLRCLKKLTKA